MFQKNYDTFTYQNEDTFNLSEEMYDYIGSENIKKIKTLAPPMQEATINLYKECKEIGIHFEIVSARRTFEEQKELYDKYNKLYGDEKVKPPDESPHQAGIAIDIKIGNSNSYNPDYDKVAEIWKKKSEEYFWGGDEIEEYWHFSIERNGRNDK